MTLIYNRWNREVQTKKFETWRNTSNQQKLTTQKTSQCAKKRPKKFIVPLIIPCFITCTPMNNRSMKSLNKKKCKRKLKSWQWFWNMLKNILGPTQKPQNTPKKGTPQRLQCLQWCWKTTNLLQCIGEKLKP